MSFFPKGGACVGRGGVGFGSGTYSIDGTCQKGTGEKAKKWSAHGTRGRASDGVPACNADGRPEHWGGARLVSSFRVAQSAAHLRSELAKILSRLI